MFQSVAFLAERDEAEMSVGCGQVDFDSFLYKRFLFEPVGNQVGYGDKFKSPLVSALPQFGQSGHRAVVAHYFHECCSRLQTGQARQVNGSFGVSAPAQNPLVLRIQWVYMTRTAECGWNRCRVGQSPDCGATVVD